MFFAIKKDHKAVDYHFPYDTRANLQRLQSDIAVLDASNMFLYLGPQGARVKRCYEENGLVSSCLWSFFCFSVCSLRWHGFVYYPKDVVFEQWPNPERRSTLVGGYLRQKNLTWQATMFKIGAGECKPTHCIALAALRILAGS